MTNFKTRKRDGQVFPTDRKSPRDSGSATFVGVDRSQISSETKLEPQYDSRKSFYGKAIQRTEDGKLILRSYDTDVAYIKDGVAVVEGSYSPTTTRHIKEFLKQNGFKVESTKQMLKDYSKDKAVKKSVPIKTEKEFIPSISKDSMGTTFEIGGGIKVIARTTDSRDGFNHVADLYKDGVLIGTSKAHYINRTWEQYEYESVIKDLLNKKGVSKKEQEVIMNTTKNLSIGKSDAELKTIASVSALGDIFGKTTKEKNVWKLRMLKAGLEKKGLQVPADWDKLSEKEKEIRLNKVIKFAKSKGNQEHKTEFGTMDKSGKVTKTMSIDIKKVKSDDPLAYSYGYSQAKAGQPISKDKNLAPEYIRGYKDAKAGKKIE